MPLLLFSGVRSPSGGKFRIGDVTIGVIPMGLADDSELSELGINRHAMEDYLIKLLLHDQALTRDVSDFRQLMLDLTLRIREQGPPFDSSKEVFQLAKPIVKHGFSDTGTVEALFERATPSSSLY